MYGDHPRSPGRRDEHSDARQPSPPEQARHPFGPAVPPEDVRVAGNPFGAPAGPGQGDGSMPGRPHGADTIGDDDGSARAGAPGSGAAGKGLATRLPVKLAAVAGAAVVLVGVGAVAAFAMTGGEENTTVKPRALADAPKPPDPKVLEEQRRQQNLDRASRAAVKDAGKPMELEAKGHTPTPTPTSAAGGDGDAPPAGNPVPAGEAQRIAKAMLPSFGFDPSTQFGCLVNLWQKESGWRHTAQNPTSGAYGIPQALPGSKMASAGADWRTNPRTQIKWGLGYIKGRYGNPCGAWSHSQRVGWY
ncbi:hypothetical protein SAMN04489712_105315 [Thermomonospora echinospora]|uniref:Transglycosylase SLT domain-containing protein n=1 Tax=Thermomonospora echinospora TaxID=1992 RepID=A0A1H6AA75_9ACTN|nr:lytic transglycosylase domain-containing protein [Thermomonospora echinospora]SEG45643.1 hypothetical protein SAMN04489712_105315 [Thermomonospora echinospora]